MLYVHKLWVGGSDFKAKPGFIIVFVVCVTRYVEHENIKAILRTDQHM